MLEFLANVLNLIVQPCYALTHNWWVAIALFTLITKVILMPLALWVQKNSIVMVQVMPDLNRIKVKHYGDRETIGEEQTRLNKEHGYHPLLSLIPLAVQVLILFGLVDVIHGITDHGAPGTEILGMVPVIDGGISWIMPVLAGLSAVAMGFAQNRINPLQREQSRAEKNFTNGTSIALSLFLGFFVAAGMAFYWVVSNLSAILVQVACNIIIKPSKHIDYADLAASREELDKLNALEEKRPWYKPDPQAKRERADYRRFFNVAHKHLVFYSEGSGFYKYFKGAIEWLLAHSTLNIHYVTNDPDDQIFAIAEREPRIHPYYIGPKRTITLFMKMDADVMATTLEDLETYYLKRSYVRKDIEYVFFFHHMTSTHLTPQKESYAHYDTLLCVGQHQVDELRRAEELYDFPEKTLVPCGYDLLDSDIAAYEALPAEKKHHERPVVLIGPSWQEGNLLDSCIDELLGQLLARHCYRIIVRPHPEYVKRYRPRWEALQGRFAAYSEDELLFERDFSSDETIFTSDLLVTDWSSVAYEFSFATKKPCVFIDTPMKVNNPHWRELGIEPTDISLRRKVGASLSPDGLEGFERTVAGLLARSDTWREHITRVTAEHVFNLGHSAEVAGRFLLDEVLKKQGDDGRQEPPGSSGDGDSRRGHRARQAAHQVQEASHVAE